MSKGKSAKHVAAQLQNVASTLDKLDRELVMTKQVQQAPKQVQVARRLGRMAMVNSNVGKAPVSVIRISKSAKKREKKKRQAMTSLHNNNASSMIAKETRMKSRYYASLMDPWAELNAKYPEPGAYKSIPFQVKFETIIKSNADGRCCFILRDGISRCYSISDDGQGTSTMSYNTVGPNFGWYLSGNNWVPTPEDDTIRSTFSGYRPVSMGTKFTYTAAPVDASGRIATALWPPGETLPVDSLATNVTFDELARFQGACTYAAIEGCTQTWKPFSTFGMAEYRQTNTVFFNNGYSVDSSWDIDQAMVVTGYLVSEMVALKVALSSNGTTVTGNWTDSSSNTFLESLLAFRLPSQSPAIIMIFDGVPHSTEIGMLETVVNYEAISDNRTFSLVQNMAGEHQPGYTAERDAALNAMPTVLSHSGSVPHTDWMSNVASAASATAKTVGAVSTIVDLIGSLALI